MIFNIVLHFFVFTVKSDHRTRDGRYF